MTTRAYARLTEATSAVEMFPGVERTTLVSGDSMTLVRVEVAAGGGYMIPGELPHFFEALEDSTLVEVFSPEREEFAHD